MIMGVRRYDVCMELLLIALAKIMWAVEETGKNSVNPSITARMIASRKSIFLVYFFFGFLTSVFESSEIVVTFTSEFLLFFIAEYKMIP